MCYDHYEYLQDLVVQHRRVSEPVSSAFTASAIMLHYRKLNGTLYEMILIMLLLQIHTRARGSPIYGKSTLVAPVTVR